MLHFGTSRTRPVSLCLVTAPPDPRAIGRAATLAFMQGRVRPRRNRVILFAPDVALADMPVSTVFEVQRKLAWLQEAAGVYRQMTSMLVSEDPGLDVVAETFRAAWQATRVSIPPRILTSATLAEAAEIIALPSLEADFAPLLAEARAERRRLSVAKSGESGRPERE